MPGAPARPPGWRQRGCRRRPRTGRIARSRRSATRPPHQAGPVRSRHAGLPRPAPRTGASCCPGRARCTRARTARVVPPGAAGQPGWPRTSPARPREAEEHLAGEGVAPRVQRRKLALQLEDVYVAGQPIEQGLAGGHGVLRGGPLPGRHVTTVRQNHRSGGLSSKCPLPAGAAQRRHPLATLRRCLMGCATHVNRRSGRFWVAGWVDGWPCITG